MGRISVSGDHPFARDAVIALILKNNGQEKGGNNVTDDSGIWGASISPGSVSKHQKFTPLQVCGWAPEDEVTWKFYNLCNFALFCQSESTPPIWLLLDRLHETACHPLSCEGSYLPYGNIGVVDKKFH